MADSTILIVDDEAAIRDVVGITLDLAGFETIKASNAHEAHVSIIDQKPDLVLLDWMLPGGSGIELARRLRRDEFTSNIPIIMLTAKASEDNKVQGLNEGVDDYVTKPFSPRELVARIKTVLRRVNGKDKDQVLQVFDLKLNPTSHRVTIEDELVEMGPTEFRLLKFFLQNQEKVFSRDHIQNSVWGANCIPGRAHHRRAHSPPAHGAVLGKCRGYRLFEADPDRPQRRLPLLGAPGLRDSRRRVPVTAVIL